ncbi:MAG: UDP-glucose 4-epimerase GalE [Sphingobacteriales bacterium SCN 48-20]|jgi:UDP-glucose 4-epimerase|uniref:UDP-glucose 4-epimerase GalE n=1 Tax=Terrimonas ferruginea TaxID=249 RepID=UPI00086C0485|nr:UDP-glucose 4-epimerase GalE [Terrimonas ferruginea]MBN8784667.1 UDP-glucose 4-epimerase GalE [Terrimonas ferruginea]ODT91725.1 MAG: UDP-glucose 4-epimerase GalE [Sphingobacteriales bacterium SCN 48-20]OJW39611.1 MAG: UDP-glucose 4-epimerase GalE [Sphingobacteriales bacterium 48-107]
MAKILVTGGCGYIGSHTLVDLIQNGYTVISADNNSRSNPGILNGVEQITGKTVKNYKVDLCNFDDTFAIFQENPDIAGIIHFAAYKAVGESVEKPLMYFENNITSLINLLKCVQEFHVPHFVFSSSCTVYGTPDDIPVTELTIPKPAESPYGYTKQMGEQIINEFAKSSGTRCILLRYFNPVGAHPSAKIGELPIGRPQNLVPAITQTAIGKLPSMTVHGSDYPTRDGSCIRDYIHVSDIGHAHTLALQYLEQGKNKRLCDVFNLGTGNGVSVLEAIHTFEKVSGVKLNYTIGPRRSGDVVAIYANNDLARNELGWNPEYTLEDMLSTAWEWEQRLLADDAIFGSQPKELN